MTTLNKSCLRFAPRVSAASRSEMSELSGCVGDNQNLLEESSDKDDGNFRAVINTENCDRQGAESRRGQIPEKFNKRLLDSRYGRESAAQNAQRDANNRRQHETPEDDLDTVPETLM